MRNSAAFVHCPSDMNQTQLVKQRLISAVQSADLWHWWWWWGSLEQRLFITSYSAYMCVFEWERKRGEHKSNLLVPPRGFVLRRGWFVERRRDARACWERLERKIMRTQMHTNTYIHVHKQKKNTIVHLLHMLWVERITTNLRARRETEVRTYPYETFSPQPLNPYYL